MQSIRATIVSFETADEWREFAQSYTITSSMHKLLSVLFRFRRDVESRKINPYTRRNLHNPESVAYKRLEKQEDAIRKLSDIIMADKINIYGSLYTQFDEHPLIVELTNRVAG